MHACMLFFDIIYIKKERSSVKWGKAWLFVAIQWATIWNYEKSRRHKIAANEFTSLNHFSEFYWKAEIVSFNSQNDDQNTNKREPEWTKLCNELYIWICYVQIIIESFASLILIVKRIHKAQCLIGIKISIQKAKHKISRWFASNFLFIAKLMSFCNAFA